MSNPAFKRGETLLYTGINSTFNQAITIKILKWDKRVPLNGDRRYQIEFLTHPFASWVKATRHEYESSLKKSYSRLYTYNSIWRQLNALP